jgi:hypothetical protein
VRQELGRLHVSSAIEGARNAALQKKDFLRGEPYAGIFYDPGEQYNENALRQAAKSYIDFKRQRKRGA